MIAANLITLAVAAAGAAAAPIFKRESGQATYYAAGLGACGWTNSGSDFIVALNAPQWGGSSGQKSSHCGQQVVITNNKNGNTQTATVSDLCPGCSYGSLDMSEGLFSALNNGNMGDGVFPISWHWAGQGGDNQAEQKQQEQKAAETPKPTPKEVNTRTRTSSPTSSPTPTKARAQATTVVSSTTSAAAQPASTDAPGTVTGTPLYWAEIENSCGFTPDEYTIPVAIAPSALLEKEDLYKACGKWIQIENNQNGKALSVQVTSYLPDSDRASIALAEGYKRLANNAQSPEEIDSVTWGFIANQGM